MKKLSLNGKWEVLGISPEGETKCLTAAVPGFIHLDLEREKIIPDMFWRDNANLCQWVEDWEWTYSREFVISDDEKLEFSVLQFKGLDTFAEITINDKIIANACNMHTPYSFEGKNILRHGKNTVSVRFTPYQKMVEGKKMDYPTAFNNPDRNYVRRMQCTFYWDWVNRFVTFGIWRDVEIYFYEAAHIEDFFVYTNDIAKTSASLNVVIDTEYSDEKYICREHLEIISPDKICVFEENFDVFDRTVHIQADIENPQLWWPAGYGLQPLYTAKVTLFAPDGKIIDNKSVDFGIRTTRIEQIKDKINSDDHKKSIELREKNSKMGDMTGSSFILLVNGERIFCKGGNWVPADPFPSRISTEKYDKLISLAKDSGMNLLRCWGGGIYEPQDFYDACNKYGIMISQDFQFACAHYPEDNEEFMENVRREIPIVIRQLRNNPCIAWWAGNNENGMHYDWDYRFACDRRIAREILYPNLALLDPSRPFLPASPFGGKNVNDQTTGDCHMSFWWYRDGNYRENMKKTGRFMSEYAIAGSPLKYTLDKFMADEDFIDPKNEIFEFHVKDNPHKAEGEPTIFGGLEMQSDLCMGKYKDLDDRIRKYAYIQYEWTRLSIEAARRNKWYTAGIQYWMYNDCWPAVGWSMVDWYLIPKAAWYAAKRSCKPIAASVLNTESGYDFNVLNDSLKDRRGIMTVYVQNFNGNRRELFKSVFYSKANENTVVRVLDKKTVALTQNEAVICDISGEFESDRAFFYNDLPKDMEFLPTKLEYWISGGQKGTITFKSKDYARIVTIEGDLVLSDNFFDLCPNEEKTVEFTCNNGFDITSAEIYCWNGI